MMIKCPECGKEISDSAKRCPNCGFKQPLSKLNKELIVGMCLIPLIVVFIICVSFYSKKQSEKNMYEALGGAEWDATKDDIERLQSEIDKTRIEIENIKDKYNSKVEESESTQKMYDDLIDRYFELYEKEELSDEELEQMKTIAYSLVHEIPDLEPYYNKETGLLNIAD